MTSDRLPDALIDAVISKLILTYGKRFTGHYDPFTPAQVREYWAHELGSMSEAGVRYALDHLPHEHPPTVLTFRQIGVSRPDDSAPRLPAPQASPSVKRASLEALVQLQQHFAHPPHKHNHLAWAERILANPQGKSLYARKMAEEVLRKAGRLE